MFGVNVFGIVFIVIGVKSFYHLKEMTYAHHRQRYLIDQGWGLGLCVELLGLRSWVGSSWVLGLGS